MNAFRVNRNEPMSPVRMAAHQCDRLSSRNLMRKDSERGTTSRRSLLSGERECRSDRGNCPFDRLSGKCETPG